MIKLAGKADTKELNEIISKEFPYKAFSPEKLDNRMVNPGIVIFKKTVGKKFAGFIEIEFKEGIGLINALSVKKGFRRKGYGKELLEHAILFLKNNQVEQARLLVKKENETAKKLYQTTGFIFRGIHGKKIEDSTVEIWERNLQEEDIDYLN
ncbi:MAG: GNAT family N-acetyltransferase [archaeon]|nr:GNAT family N-acetyltransferase [archaeon]